MPVLFTALGDVFFQPDSGGIWWLNTGTAEVTRVAGSVDQFRELLGTEIVDEWFLPSLIEQLHAAGKVPDEGECYTYVTLPVFEEGKYEVENLNPVPAYEHFALTGDIHCEILSRPLGGKSEPDVAS
ncbi:MAG TPA: T6SS immunity protein Tdi1 domain-containing protein [Gallionella sp.]|nr:T6SS immunity protein Tdi1 domain-containing protein [Gallionella sp.]